MYNSNMVESFESKFAKKFNVKAAVSFPYGRSAQWAFFKAMKISGKEIIMPAYTCSVVAHAITLSGNKPKFIDVNLDDFNMDLKLLKKSINNNTHAIIATHTFGYPQNIIKIEKIIKEAEIAYGHKIWIMQDCCHAFNAEWKGKRLSSSGDVSVFAFNISKMITSVFGGMLTFQDIKLADKVRQWRDENFKNPSTLKVLKRKAYLLFVWIAFNKYFYYITYYLIHNTKLLYKQTDSYHLDEKIHFPPDYMDKMSNFEAAVGIDQLDRYDGIIKQRSQIAKWYFENLKTKKGWKLPPLLNGATYSHYVVIVEDREKEKKYFSKKGIEVGELIQYSIPAINQYSTLGYKCKNSDFLSTRTINLPLTENLEKIKKYFG